MGAGDASGPAAAEPARERDAAVAIARETGALLRAHFARGVATEWKDGHDPVSAADRDAEDLIRARLAARFPGDVVVGEEGEEVAEASVRGRRRWYVDPLDGTTNFLKGRDRWAVSIAFCDAHDRVAAAAIHLPRTGALCEAVLGGGATQDGTPLRCGTTTALPDALVALGALTRGRPDQEVAAALAGQVLSLRVTGSGAADLVDVAAGRADAFLTTGSGRWDLAAGALLAAEAGATVTTARGAAATGPTETIVAAAPGLHPALLAVLAERDGASRG